MRLVRPLVFARPLRSVPTLSVARQYRVSLPLRGPKSKEELEEEEDERELQALMKEEEDGSLVFKVGARRSGVIGEKLGMMNLFDHWGKHLTVTVVRIDNHVIHHNEAPCHKTGLATIKVGAGERKPKKTPDWLARMCERAKCEFKMRLHDFPVTEDAVIPVGTRIHARHFLPGQFIDVTGVTVGRGFQGVMYKYGFRGMKATHGVSLTHRSHGSTGQTGMSRVFPGKKMAGRMGNNVMTKLNSRIYRIDTDRNLLFLLGSVPGPQGFYLPFYDVLSEFHIGQIDRFR
jgi:large subunit ribosomal protein L3